MSNPPRPGAVPPRPPQTPLTSQQTPRPRPPQPGAARPPADLATRLDGQRGWLNELDNSLRKRSIIALVLTCLAVGVGAAAMYIAITRNSDGDRITALETRIEALEAATGATTSEILPPTDTTIPETGVTDPGTILPPTGTTGTTTTIPAE